MGSSKQLKQLNSSTIRIGDENITTSGSARNIGAIYDDKLSLKEHVNSVCKSYYLYLRHIGKVRPFTLIHLTDKI